MHIIPILLYLASWVFAILLTHFTQFHFSTALMKCFMLFSVGLQGIWAFVGHYFHFEKVAQHIGWQTSPFQHEVAFANLSYGILGVLSFWFFHFWIATTIGISIFMFGAAWIHFKDIKASGNYNLGNSGPILYLDVIIPISLIFTIFFAYGRS